MVPAIWPPRLSTVGNAYDNAMCESFFATLECELLERRRFASQAEARIAIFGFVEGWCNPVRLHSAPGYRSPIDYERQMQEASITAWPPKPTTVHQIGATSDP